MNKEPPNPYKRPKTDKPQSTKIEDEFVNEDHLTTPPCPRIDVVNDLNRQVFSQVQRRAEIE